MDGRTDSPPIKQKAQPSWAFCFISRALGENPRSTEPAQQAKERQSAATAALAEGEAHSAE